MVFGVLRYALEQFGFLLCHTKDAQIHKNTALMEGQCVETEKMQFYRKENCVLGRGMAKEGFFCCFQICTRTHRKLTVWLQWCSNSRTSRPLGNKSCSKKSKSLRKKNCFSGKKRHKMGFWGFHVCTKTLGNFTVGLRRLPNTCNNPSIRFTTCWNRKKACLREKITWYQKNLQKNFFFGGFQGLH